MRVATLSFRTLYCVVYSVLSSVAWHTPALAQQPPDEIRRELARIERLFQQGVSRYSAATGVSSSHVASITDRYARTVKAAIQKIDGDTVTSWKRQGKDETEAKALALVNQILDSLHRAFSDADMQLVGRFYLDGFDGVILAHYYGTGLLSEVEVLILKPLNDQIRKAIAVMPR